MIVHRAFAPAKVNLTLHVTGRRSDGYHLLDSLVVFGGVGDQLSVQTAQELSLIVEGPFKQGVPTDDTNIVLRAAHALRAARGLTGGATIRLAKHMPHAAGIGGGSADAAAVLGLLAKVWGTDPVIPDEPWVAELGADVPVCLSGPSPMRMGGVGDLLTPAPRLPPFALVLANAGQPVPTTEVFAGLSGHDGDTMPPIPDGLDFDGLCAWIGRQRNDLQPVAEAICPGVGQALDRLQSMREVRLSLMSGSGGTCVGIVRDMAAARTVARALQVREMGWWVAPAPVLT